MGGAGRKERARGEREREKGPEAAVDLVPFLDSRGLGVQGASQGFRNSQEGGFGAGGGHVRVVRTLVSTRKPASQSSPGDGGWGSLHAASAAPVGLCPPRGEATTCAVRGEPSMPSRVCGGKGFSVFPGECSAPGGRALPTPGVGGGSAKHPASIPRWFRIHREKVVQPGYQPPKSSALVHFRGKLGQDL